MNLDHERGGTVDAALLLAYVDGELDEGARALVVDHLAACGACRASASALESRARRVAGALRSADFQPPTDGEWREFLDAVDVRVRSRARAAGLRTAAGWVIAVLAVGALAAPPLRAWLAQHWKAAMHRDADAPSAPAGDSAALSFSVQGPDFLVVFTSVQAGGHLQVRFTEDETVNVRVTGRDGGALVAGREVLRVRNEGRSEASYRLAVPRGVDEVSVRVGAAPPVVLRRAAGGLSGGIIRLDRGVLVRNHDPGDEP